MNLGGRETSLAERQLSESRWATYSNQERGAWYGHGKGFAQDLKTSRYDSGHFLSYTFQKLYTSPVTGMVVYVLHTMMSMDIMPNASSLERRAPSSEVVLSIPPPPKGLSSISGTPGPRGGQWEVSLRFFLPPCIGCWLGDHISIKKLIIAPAIGLSYRGSSIPIVLYAY